EIPAVFLPLLHLGRQGTLGVVLGRDELLGAGNLSSGRTNRGGGAGFRGRDHHRVSPRNGSLWLRGGIRPILDPRARLGLPAPRGGNELDHALCQGLTLEGDRSRNRLAG